MRVIMQLSEQIKEELEDARKYAKLATHYKTEYPMLAKVYYDLANEELSHCDRLHNEVVKLIEKTRAEKEPPKVMLELWEYEHESIMEEYGIVKNMISLYNK